MTRRFLVLAALTLALTGFSRPAVAQHVNPVGTWSGTATHQGQVDQFQMFFARDGSACLLTAFSAGHGHWYRTGGTTFVIKVKEVFDDGTGYVLIDSHAVQVGNTFTSTGISKLYDSNGNLLASGQSDVAATRTSTANPDCEI